ncbi:hypothetical protein IAQ61_004452 [Plenodomus lingam]|uniref:Predicted protein n=1 Tax=Leptosphaeria maculans (strain JN3 / isolate v23.1.3 / race Av1-4-5-6-7-8) TaxID=985895 RepID=E4ZVJ9_LEPMJ|nr:predicted protein [Plenodomus lingam JN3]KAH9873825.1 hypothetical protein IAQ61_004452 [Plenodomus lingam]CBX95625.1 predicted protein [Plenodomus lingam JN3]
MEPRAEDYYDMPVDLLPSANFAGRPMSDISMLDGMWTMIISSSDEEEDGEDNVKGQITSRLNLPQAAETKATRPGIQPEIRISSSSSEDLKARLRRLSDDVKIMERPRPRKKSKDDTRAGGSIERKFNDAELPPPWRPLPPVPEQRGASNSSSRFEVQKTSDFPGSISQKLRVQKTLRQKKMGTLKTHPLERDARRAPNSANSMLKTPRELYAIPERQATHGEERDPQVIHDAPSEGIDPHSWTRRSTRAISPANTVAASPSPVQASAPLGDTQEIKVAIQRIYEPGPIHLQEHAAMHRRDSVASLDEFDGAQDKTQESADRTAEEAVILFFADLGVVDEVTDASLDRYWLGPSRRYSVDYSYCHEPDESWRRPSNTSVTETRAVSPSARVAHSLDGEGDGDGSRFSSSSTSSNTYSPPANKSARTRLGRLLSPALPGTAFLRAPAIFEKQAKRWQARNEGG